MHEPTNSESEDMLPEYSLTDKQGERGKYHQAYYQGHTVRVIQEDGSVQVQYFTLEDGAIGKSANKTIKP